jgi:hypothetical protein
MPAQIDKGLYPKAFCKIIPDLLAGDPGRCLLRLCPTRCAQTAKRALRALFWQRGRVFVYPIHVSILRMYATRCAYVCISVDNKMRASAWWLTRIPAAAEYCNIMHADGAGTKSSLAYMYWKETGDVSVWRGIAQVYICVLNKIIYYPRISIWRYLYVNACV